MTLLVSFRFEGKTREILLAYLRRQHVSVRTRALKFQYWILMDSLHASKLKVYGQVSEHGLRVLQQCMTNSFFLYRNAVTMWSMLSKKDNTHRTLGSVGFKASRKCRGSSRNWVSLLTCLSKSSSSKQSSNFSNWLYEPLRLTTIVQSRVFWKTARYHSTTTTLLLLCSWQRHDVTTRVPCRCIVVRLRQYNISSTCSL